MSEKLELVASCLYGAAALLYLAAAELEEKNHSKWRSTITIKKKRKKRVWMKQERRQFDGGNIQQMLNEFLLFHNEEVYKSRLQMNESCFRKLLSYIERDIYKMDTLLRSAVPVTEKLAVTLRILVTGEKFKDVARSTKMSCSYLVQAVPEVCEAICSNLGKEFLQFPSSSSKWHEIANDFESEWEFPCCLGALGSYHVAFVPLHRIKRNYINSMGFTSIILLGMVDAHGRFMFIDVGCNGRASDEEALKSSNLMALISNEEKNIPKPQIFASGKALPYVIVGNESLPLMTQLMTPYAQPESEFEKTFNWRLSRAHQSVARAFDIMTSRFEILRKTTLLKERKLKLFVKCCCILHNFLIAHCPDYLEASSINEEYLKKHKRLNMTKGEEEAKDVRNAFADYFYSGVDQ